MGATPARLDLFSPRGIAGLTALLATAALLPAAGVAQNDLEALLECRSLRNDVQRLACYDRALGVPAAAEPRPAEPARAASAPADAAGADGKRPAEAERSSEPALEREVAVAPRAGRSQASAADARQEEPQAFDIVVVEVHRVEPTNATFVTEDGEVWRQIDGRRSNFATTPFEAEIRPGALGSHFLVPKAGGRAIRVRLEDD